MNKPVKYPHWPFSVVGQVSPATKKMITVKTNVNSVVASIQKLRKNKNDKQLDALF